MKHTKALPEMYTLGLKFAQYPYKGLLFKDVVVWLHKPTANTEEVLSYPLSWMIRDYQPPPRVLEHDADWLDWLALDAIARDFFLPDEVCEIAQLIAGYEDPAVTILKDKVEWPIENNTSPCNFGGYGPSSLSLHITDTIEGYAYSVYDFETIDGKQFDQVEMDTVYVGNS